MARKNKKKKTFGDFLMTLLMLAALAVFVFSGYTLYGFYQEYHKGTVEYDNLESSYAVSSDEDETEDLDALEDDDALLALQQLSGREIVTVEEDGKEISVPTMRNPIDFDELLKVNEDIVGWLRVRAIDISYPVVQAEDNDYYLHRTFEKEDNFAGCLFVNCDNSRDLTDQNTIIYGHNMKNGSMFGKLKLFREEGTFEKSKYFWMFTPDLIYQYRIFSAAVVNKTGLAYQSFYTDEAFDEWISYAFENSEIDNQGIEVTKDDRVMTLSTCTGDDSTRFVVMGKLVQIYASK